MLWKNHRTGKCWQLQHAVRHRESKSTGRVKYCSPWPVRSQEQGNQRWEGYSIGQRELSHLSAWEEGKPGSRSCWLSRTSKREVRKNKKWRREKLAWFSIHCFTLLSSPHNYKGDTRVRSRWDMAACSQLETHKLVEYSTSESILIYLYPVTPSFSFRQTDKLLDS